MIRKFSRLNASPRLVTAMFHDVEHWPEWMAGVRSVRLIESQGQTRVIHLVQVQQGRTMRQKLELDLEPFGMTQRQLEGRFRRWETTWRFLDPPDGRGTTVAFELDLDLGLMGLMIPSRTIQTTLDSIFDRTIRNARKRCRRLAAEAAAEIFEPDPSQHPAREVLLRILRHDDHLELQLAGRRFKLEEID